MTRFSARCAALGLLVNLLFLGTPCLFGAPTQPRLCRKTPSSARERAVFRVARTAKQAISVVSSMEPDAVQTKNKPLEARSSSPTQPSVLLICIDDLRPVLGCYGGAARTPNLDRFSESAVTFQRHYVQFPSCGPSRACMMGGIRPNTLSLDGNAGAWAIASAPETRPTMPLHFRNHGYTTLSFGKTYHGKGIGRGFGWSETPWHPPCGWTCYVNVTPPKTKGQYMPAFEIYNGPDRAHGDYHTADQAMAALEDNKDRPFFIAAGFYKPHLPFVAPKRYWDLYEHDQIKPLGPLTIPENALLHQYSFREICSYGMEEGTRFTPETMPTMAQARELIHAYYAAVSFNDAQVGRLLKKLDDLGLADKTVVVVWSDHGFHLGDQARWAKWTQFEADMRSPLMIRLPGKDRKPRSTHALVESVDLYPTLAHYCGLTLPAHLAGTSLLPLLTGKVDQVKEAAYSQVRTLKKNSHLLAYSLRTPQYRYIEWRDTTRNCRLVDTELYDLGLLGVETRNVATDPAYEEALKACAKLSVRGYPARGRALKKNPKGKNK